MKRRFEIYQGDLADCGCDVIVNSSNTRCALGAGVSRRVFEICGGDEYQRHISAELASRFPDPDAEGGGPLGLMEAGRALLTGAGAAADEFLAVVHAAAVDYERPVRADVPPMAASTSPAVIEECTFHSLEEVQHFCDQRGLASVSVGIPLMGTSGGKISVTASARSICRGIRRFFSSHFEETGTQSAIDRVVVIVYSENDVQAVRTELLRHRLIQV